MRRTSIGSWAYNVGPYGANPIPFDTVLEKLGELKFDGVELGGFNGYPNPQNQVPQHFIRGLSEPPSSSTPTLSPILCFP